MIAWATSVRRAEVADLNALADLHLRSAHAGFATIVSGDPTKQASQDELAHDWASLLQDDPQLDRALFIAERDERVIGVLVAGRDQSDRSVGRLARAYVDPQYWSLGVVRLLFDAAMEHLRQLDCERVTMWIMEPNHRARAAAEHLGMTRSGVRQPTCERATTMPAGVEDVEYMCRLRGTAVASDLPPTSGD